MAWEPVDLSCVDEGRGRPLVFLHGLWENSRWFHHQVAELPRRGFRLLAPDMRGHGRSPAAAAGHTLPSYARDLAALLERREVSGAVLVGASMGALLAWEYLLGSGAERAAGLVVVDQSACDLHTPAWPLGVYTWDDLRALMFGVQEDFERVVRESLPLLWQQEPPADEAAWMVDEILRLPPSVAGAILFDQTLRDYRAAMPQMDLPALLCFGRDEKCTPVAAGEWLAERLPQARLAVFEHSGHYPFLEEPERFNDELARFAAELG